METILRKNEFSRGTRFELAHFISCSFFSLCKIFFFPIYLTGLRPTNTPKIFLPPEAIPSYLASLPRGTSLDIVPLLFRRCSFAPHWPLARPEIPHVRVLLVNIIRGTYRMTILSTLKDATLLSSTKSLRQKEQGALHELLCHFGEILFRKLFRDAGYSSMFAYLHEGLGYSKGGAYRRVLVARCMRKVPEFSVALKNLEFSFSGAVEIAGCENEERIRELIPQCLGKSAREIELITVMAKPEEKRKKELVRVVRVKRVAAVATETEASPEGQSLLFSSAANSSSKLSSKSGSNVETEEERRYDIRLQVDDEFMKLYQEAKAIAGGQGMEGALKKVMKDFVKRNSPKEREQRRVERQLKREAKKEVSPVATPEVLSPKVPPKVKRSRHIPLQVQDQVILRDDRRCTFVSPDGRRCNCRESLEFDHIIAFSLYGEHEVENIRIRCRAHNQLEAERVFGKSFMAFYQGGSRSLGAGV